MFLYCNITKSLLFGQDPDIVFIEVQGFLGNQPVTITLNFIKYFSCDKQFLKTALKNVELQGWIVSAHEKLSTTELSRYFFIS